MKFFRKGLVCLLAFVMTMSMTPMSVFAAGGADAGDTGKAGTDPVYKVTNPEPSTENGLYTSKSLSLNDDGTGTITLETYVEGSIQQTGTPSDIVLVLDVSQSMSQSMSGSTTRLEALKSAVNAFIETTAKKNESAKSDDKKSRISIVSFSGSASVVSDFSTDATTLKSKVNALTTSRGTAADYGMQKAQSQITSIPASRESNKVVIFFTDGEPNHGSGSFDTSVANDAISASKTIKASGATVYSIGVVSGADPSLDPTKSSTSNINKFLHGVSSNYPDATTYTNLGTRAKDSEGKDLTCYMAATSASELEKIFEDIGEAAVPTIALDANTVVQDVMSKYFEVNGKAADIKTYTSDYKGNGNFDTPETAPDSVKAAVKDGEVQVTGFDFEPVIDKDDGSYQGQKLIIEIPVKLTDDAKKMSGETLDSNNKTTSAIYNGELNVRTFGTPKVTIPKAKITIKANSHEKTYDGTALTDDGYTYTENKLVDGDVLTAVVEGSQTDAGSSANTVTSYKVMRGKADVTDKYDISTEAGTLTVNKKAVTFTGESDSKVYNGKEQEITKITQEGLLDGHKYEGLTYSAKGTNVGEYDGEFKGTVKIMNGQEDVTKNYDITQKPGKLTITQNTDKVVVTITENSGTATYDGTEKTVTGYKVTDISSNLYTKDDFEFKGDATVKGTDAGTYNMELKPGDFENKNANFKSVEFKIVDGTLKIAKKAVTFTGESDSKVYNGKEQEITEITPEGLLDGHEYSGLSYSAKGKDVGEYDGTFSGDVVIKDAQGNDVTKNYKATQKPGKLTITQAEAEVTIVGNTYTTDYTGKEQSVNGFTTPNLPGGITVTLKDGKQASVTKTNAGTYSMGLTKDDFNVTSDNYKITKVTYTDGWLTINKIPVTITVADAEKVYGNEDPKFAEAAMAGQIEGELKDVDLTVSRSDAGDDTLGTHEGVLKVNGTKESLEKEYTNYTFTVGTGNFTITENTADLHVSAPDVTKTYDGEAVGTTATAGIAGATIKYMDEKGKYTLDECPTITNAGSKTVKFQASLYGYTSATGEATLTVNPKEVTLTSEGGTQVYNGKAFEKPEVAGGDAFVKGEVTDIKAIGSVTNVGKVTNEITFTTSDKFNEKNYTITKTEGTLEVTPAVLTVTADDKTKKQGEDNPELTGTITGFVNGEDADVLKGEAKYTTTAVKNSPVGKYPITASGNLEAQNYTIEYVDGTLTITEAPAPAAKTGDDFQIWLIAGIALLALAGAGAVFFARRRKTN